MARHAINAMSIHRRQLEKSNSSTKISYEFKMEKEEERSLSADIFINADKIRINHCPVKKAET